MDGPKNWKKRSLLHTHLSEPLPYGYPTCTDPNPNCTLKLKCTDHRFHPPPTFHSHTRLRNHDTNLVVRLCKISCPTKLVVEQDRSLQNLVRQNRAVLYISRPSTFWTVQLLTFDLTINYHTKIRFSGPSIFIFSSLELKKLLNIALTCRIWCK